MKKTACFIGVLVIIIVGLSVIQVTVSNQISTHGMYLSSIQEELKQVKKDNALLQEQILEKSALTNIEEEAKDLGFSPAQKEMYVSTPLPLARR